GPAMWWRRLSSPTAVLVLPAGPCRRSGMPPCVIVGFLFKLLVDARHFHSFPTRRSSDLSPSRVPRPGWVNSGWARRAAAFSRRRSEEHTSELQSHLNLVCRLLLEKKKKKHQTSRRMLEINIETHVRAHDLAAHTQHTSGL